MEEFCKTEYSVENIYAWKDIIEYKKNYIHSKNQEFDLKIIPTSESEEPIPIPNKAAKAGEYSDVNQLIAQYLINKYFSGNKSIYELNVPQSKFKMVNKLMEMKMVDDQLFDDILNDIIMNLSDTLFRFMQTKEFLLYHEESKIQNELLQKEDIRDTYIIKAIEETKKHNDRKSQVLEKSKQDHRKSAIAKSIEEDNKRKSIEESNRKSMQENRKSIQGENPAQLVEKDSVKKLEDIKREKIEKLKDLHDHIELKDVIIQEEIKQETLILENTAPQESEPTKESQEVQEEYQKVGEVNDSENK